MAPMTRALSFDNLVPTKLMAEYYARRAADGLIITEGTVIQSDALGYRNVADIFSTEQIQYPQIRSSTLANFFSINCLVIKFNY